MRKIFEFSDPVRGVEARYGFLVYNKHCQYVGKALELYGEYCQHEIELFQQLIKPTDVVWEIGANTGSQSVALAKQVPEGSYVGFEPQHELFKLLVTNLTLNNCENAFPYNFALGKESDVISLPKVDYHLPNNFGAVSLIGSTQLSDVKVEVRSVDSFTWLPRPNFIKIDVEGMETSVLEGGLKTISEMAPTMYIENDRVDKSSDLIQTLWDLKYDLYWHITPYYNEKNFFDNRHNIYGNVSSFNMLCFHAKNKVTVNGSVKITDKYAHPLGK